MGQMRHTKFWSENLKVRDQSKDLRSTWKNNIRMDFREIGWEVVDWIHLALDTDQWWGLMNTVMNLRVP
jgi:hypothetical protein